MIDPEENTPYERPQNEAELLEYYGLPADGDLSEIMA